MTQQQIFMTRAEVWAKKRAKCYLHFRDSFAVQNDPQILSPNPLNSGSFAWVGADGVGMTFPIFAVNCSRLPLPSRRMREKRRKAKKNEKN